MEHTRDVFPRVQEEFVETGRVQYVFRHFPLEQLHPLAFKASEAVECAVADDKYWLMHDLLFEAGGALAVPDLLKYATSLGLDVSNLRTCLDSDAMAMRVSDDRDYGIGLGVASTPTFFIAEVQADGEFKLLARIQGTRPYAFFRFTLEEVLSEVSSADR